MSNQYISLNGTSFNPTSVDQDVDKIGESRRMANATLRYYHRGNKNKWSIKWSNLKETSIAAIETIARLTTSFTFVDYDNTSYTVMVLPGDCKKALAADKVSNLGVKHYDIDLTINEV